MLVRKLNDWQDRWKHAGAEYCNGLEQDYQADQRIETKSRWIVQGSWDPDVEAINRSPPCPTAHDLMLVLHVLAAVEVEAITADVRAAFMQSEPGLRGGMPLYATPPSEGLPAVSHHPPIDLCAEVYGYKEAQTDRIL
eukprot:1056302-Amphidinium_carterae.1